MAQRRRRGRQDEPQRSEWTEDDERRFPSEQEYGDYPQLGAQRGWWEDEEDRRSEERRGYGQERGDYARQRGQGQGGYGQRYAGDYARQRGGFGRAQGGYRRDPYERYGYGQGDRGFGSSGFEQGGWAPQYTGYGQQAGYGDQGRFGEERAHGFAGRGPKGYRRSQQRVLEDVSQALEDDDEIDASNIEVSCEASEVVLRGSVPDRRTKRLAEECAESIPGVKDVRNEIRVTREGEAKPQGRQPSAS